MASCVALGTETQARHSEVARQPEAFLRDADHRIRFHFTLKHASWLNQIELWFSIFARKILRRGSFTSTQDIKDKIENFIVYFNETLAKAFQWTVRGSPLTI
jgi:hypothetical protein